MMKQLHVAAIVFSAVMVCAAADPASAQAPAGSKVTVALIGEDQVRNTRPYMRSTIAAVFEDALVATKRFRVVSQAVMGEAMKAQARAASGVIDPNTAVELGKIVQAKYVVVVKQLSMNYSPSGFFSRPTLDMSIQAQVINIQTTDLAESLTYSRKLTLSNVPVDTKKGETPPEDKLTRGYPDAVREIATEFITTAAVSLMPLETLVLSADAAQVILDAGSDTGVGVGAEFEVNVDDMVLKRPGRSDYVTKKKVARLKVSRLESEVSYAQIVETFGAGGARDTVPDPTRLKAGAMARLIPTVAAVDPKKK